MMDSLVSVIILSWNKKDEIKKSIGSVLNQTYKNIEAIVVDNNSTDGSVDMLESSGLNIRLVKLAKNLGVAGGRNVGIKAAKGEFIFFLDDDAVIVAENGLELLVNKCRENSNIAVICCKIINYYSKEVENFYFKYADEKYKDTEFYVVDFSGGASIIRRSVIDKVGVYREDSLRQAEETDLSYRILDAGYNILYYPEVEVLHKAPQGKKNEYNIFYYGIRNGLLIGWRYLPLSRAILFTLWNIFADFVRAGKIEKIGCYFKANLDAFYCLPATIFGSRKVIKKETLAKIDYLKENIISDSRKLEAIKLDSIFKYIWKEMKARFSKNTFNQNGN
ncbi:MAG: glycosyltransferase family 2 protein [Candidatus Omnitrophota bacterium]